MITVRQSSFVSLAATLATALAFAGGVLSANPAEAASAAATGAAPIAVDVAGLDLASKAGKAELAHRIDRAAEAWCAGRHDTGSNLTSRSCKAAVAEEVTEKLAARRSAARDPGARAPAAQVAAAR
ncbi:MAG: UrcA family protein [Sphingomonadales bacterium]|nr:UrcA family protein [Sphingomonadales bacterium]